MLAKKKRRDIVRKAMAKAKAWCWRRHPPACWYSEVWNHVSNHQLSLVIWYSSTILSSAWDLFQLLEILKPLFEPNDGNLSRIEDVDYSNIPPALRQGAGDGILQHLSIALETVTSHLATAIGFSVFGTESFGYYQSFCLSCISSIHIPSTFTNIHPWLSWLPMLDRSASRLRWFFSVLPQSSLTRLKFNWWLVFESDLYSWRTKKKRWKTVAVLYYTTWQRPQRERGWSLTWRIARKRRWPLFWVLLL